jgi:hypothetical protein
MIHTLDEAAFSSRRWSGSGVRHHLMFKDDTLGSTTIAHYLIFFENLKFENKNIYM